MSFADDVRAMDAEIFAESGLAELASYTPAGGGSAVEVNVILNQDVQPVFLPAGVSQHTDDRDFIDLNQSDFAAKPAVGATFVIAGVTYTIDAPPVLDDGFIWRYPLKKASV